MKTYSKTIFRFVAVMVLALFGVQAHATTVTPYDYALTAPTYTSVGIFDDLTNTLIDGALFFGAVAVIAVLVTGFFKGRAWFRRV